MWRLLMLPAVAFAVAALWIVLDLPPDPQSTAVTKECDRQVAVLHSTHDLVELRRAMFLVRWFNCGIGKRL